VIIQQEAGEWSFGGGNSGEGKVVEHLYPDGVVSEHTVELTVGNELGTVPDTDSTRAHIRKRPIAAFEIETEEELKVGTPVIFLASSSHDGGELGYVAEYRWGFRYDGETFNPITAASQEVITYTCLSDGKCAVALPALDLSAGNGVHRRREARAAAGSVLDRRTEPGHRRPAASLHQACGGIRTRTARSRCSPDAVERVLRRE